MSIDLAKNPKNIDLFEALLSHGESSASAKILFDSHLGSIAKSPIIPSTTSNLPNSFKTVREIYHRDKSDPSLNPDLIKIHKDNKLKVNQKPSRKTGGSEEVADANGTSLQQEGKIWVEKEQARIKESPSPLQKEISNKYDALDREVNQSKKDFYKSTGIKENPSGHIATDKSLFGNANEQVAEDPDVVDKHFQNLKRKAKDKLNKLLNK
ncbi:hypothetical protein [Janthinobacterium lividum]|uniref:hypothetical protein n=1 Tax=Janthinobacterium lividum TaxID=29581 RepID=UPI000FE2073B|nr:hypothetical protein [Janthinobacterium lividum]